jgi:hypothetical protein
MAAKTKAAAVTDVVAAVVLERDLWSCVCCGKGIAGGQRGVDFSIHHRIARGMGGSRDPRLGMPANLLTTCGNGTQGCHSEIESFRDRSRDRGLLLWRSQDPEQVPVEVCVQRPSGLFPLETRPYLLANNGSRTAVSP